MTRRRPSLPFALVVALACLYAVFFGALAAQAYSVHESGAYDLGNYDQAVWSAAHGLGLRLTLAPEFGWNRFAAHVEPILFLIAPLYRFVTDDPRLLLWLQAIVVALGGLPLYGLARRRLDSRWAALALVAAYYLLPAVESVTLYDFHAVGLAPTLLLAALYFLDRALATPDDPRGLWGEIQISNLKSQISNLRPQTANRESSPSTFHLPPSNFQSPISNLQSLVSKFWPSALFFVLALSTKEDISLLVFMVGLYLLILRRRWRPGLVLAAAGLAWAYAAFFVVIPANRVGGGHSVYFEFFSALGSTPLDIALAPIRTPGKVWALLATPDNAAALGMLTLPLAFTPLVGWPFFLMAAPAWAITLLSSNPLMRRLETYHYAAPAIPFIMLAAVDGVARVAEQIAKVKGQRLKVKRPSGRLRSQTSNVKSQISNLKSPTSNLQPPTSNFQLSISNLQSPTPNLQPSTSNLQLPLCLLVLAVALVYHVYRGYSPLALAYEWPPVTAHEQVGDKLAASIPPGAPVVAQAELVPLVSHRPWVQIWQGPFDAQADYFLLDISHPAFVNRKGAQENLLSDMARDPNVGVIASEDGYLLLQRGAPRIAITPEFFTFVYADPPAGAVPVGAAFGNELELVAYETRHNYADREAEPLVTLYWRATSPPAEDYFIAIFLLDEAGRPVGVTLNQQPVTVWWPTSRWEPGRTVRLPANTIPWWTGDRGRFGYGLAVVRGGDPWNVANRLPVTRADDGPAPLDDGTLLPLVTFARIAGIPYVENRD